MATKAIEVAAVVYVLFCGAATLAAVISGETELARDAVDGATLGFAVAIYLGLQSSQSDA